MEWKFLLFVLFCAALLYWLYTYRRSVTDSPTTSKGESIVGGGFWDWWYWLTGRSSDASGDNTAESDFETVFASAPNPDIIHQLVGNYATTESINLRTVLSDGGDIENYRLIVAPQIDKLFNSHKADVGTKNITGELGISGMWFKKQPTDADWPLIKAIVHLADYKFHKFHSDIKGKKVDRVRKEIDDLANYFNKIYKRSEPKSATA